MHFIGIPALLYHLTFLDEEVVSVLTDVTCSVGTAFLNLRFLRKAGGILLWLNCFDTPAVLKRERVCGVFRAMNYLFKSRWHQPEIPVGFFFSAGVGFKFGLYWRLHSDLLLLCHPTGFIVPSMYSLWKNWHRILKGYVEVWFPQHKLPWICQHLNVCLQRNEGEEVLTSCFQISVLHPNDAVLMGSYLSSGH